MNYADDTEAAQKLVDDQFAFIEQRMAETAKRDGDAQTAILNRYMADQASAEPTTAPPGPRERPPGATTVWILFYYTDGNAGDVEGVYSTEERAEAAKARHRYAHDCEVLECVVDGEDAAT